MSTIVPLLNSVATEPNHRFRASGVEQRNHRIGFVTLVTYKTAADKHAKMESTLSEKAKRCGKSAMDLLGIYLHSRLLGFGEEKNSVRFQRWPRAIGNLFRLCPSLKLQDQVAAIFQNYQQFN
jgi:hypothetical protein